MSSTRLRLTALVAALAAGLAAMPLAASARAGSLYSGPGPRPGPDILYAKPAHSPQLENHGVWKASPILVSGASAYRKGEFLYQDFLYDDHGARETPDPEDPRATTNATSRPNGTYTYPTDSDYANNAADLVELRVKPLDHATAFRITLNTFKDPSLVAFSIAIGGNEGELHEFPYGANVSAPADLFLTVHGEEAELVSAEDGTAVEPSPKVFVSEKRRQIEVRVPHEAWDPGHDRVRLAAGVGLWDEGNDRYLLPQASADDSHPGGAGGESDPAAFFNVAFRGDEPFPWPLDRFEAIASAAWWRDRAQGTALAEGDISEFHAKVNFRKLEEAENDNSAVPKTGPINRILVSHFELSQGADFTVSCFGAQANCPGQYQGRLQPYAIYVPSRRPPEGGYGLTLLLHSLSSTYNQYTGSRHQSQFGQRGPGSIVITPTARGPDGFYESYAAADVFEVWADVARRYKLDPGWTAIAGYSMGGIGTFKLGSQFPDLFARAQPTVGFEQQVDVLASLRNIPVLMWNNVGDELVNDAFYTGTAAQLDSLGYRYELDRYQPCAHPNCSPAAANHLQLALNDQYAPAAEFLGTHRVKRHPAHVTYVVFPERDDEDLMLVGDHAYWLSHLTLRDQGDGQGEIDAISGGFGAGDPIPSGSQAGAGSLPGGNLGTLTFAPSSRRGVTARSSSPATRSTSVRRTSPPPRYTSTAHASTARSI